jgi:hypothetical protein
MLRYRDNFITGNSFISKFYKPERELSSVSFESTWRNIAKKSENPNKSKQEMFSFKVTSVNLSYANMI